MFADDHWWSGTNALVCLHLHYDSFQHYWDSEVVERVIDIDSQHINISRWLDIERTLTKSLTISANNVVWIKVTTFFLVFAHSEYVFASCNLRERSDRRVRVPYIWVNLSQSITSVKSEQRIFWDDDTGKARCEGPSYRGQILPGIPLCTSFSLQRQRAIVE